MNDSDGSRIDVDPTAILVEADISVNQRKESVVLATTNTLTRVPLVPH